jgi:hypothetical protein
VSKSTEVLTEPTLERCTRRRFSAAEEQRLRAQADALPHGEQNAWLRSNGLYAAQLSQWRRALAAQGAQGLEPKPGDRKPADPRDREIERLRRENAGLEHRAQVAEDWVALQKNSRTYSNKPATRPRHECLGRTPGACTAQ